MAITILLSNFLTAQNTGIIDNLMEKYAESIEEVDGIDLNVIRERFEFFLNNPINLNTCDRDDLSSLEILSVQQIQSFFEYRKNLGKLYSLYELQAVPLFDLNTISLLAPLCTVGNYEQDYHVSLLKMLAKSKKTLYLKSKSVLEKKKGYISGDEKPAKYAGNKYNLYSKLKLNYSNHLDISFIAEKDPGEAFFTGYNKNGFDYYSGHFYLYKYKSWLKELNIGDYTISLGQGLILHNDFSRGKSSMVTNLKKNVTRVVRPYSSVNENMYFRGIAATVKIIKNIEFSIFGSYKYIDANLEERPIEYENSRIYASSLQISGFHRLKSEIEGKHSIEQKAIGGRLNYKFKNAYIGLNILSLTHDKDLIRQDKLYNRYKFSGKSLFNLSADYSLLVNRILFYGEIARSKNNAFALLQGIQYVPSSHLDLAILYRNYSKSYESINSNSFGETVGTNDEEGLYLGINWHIDNKWTLSLYQDIWKFPWLRYNISAPSYGNEYFAILKYKKRHKYSFYIQYKYENKARDTGLLRYTKNTINGNKTRLRFHINYKLNKNWELRNRIEFSNYNKKESTSNGVMIYQDIVFKPVQFPLSFTFRYAIFDTDDYSTAIYVYENDILGESLIPAYFKKGFRSYINLRYRPNTNLTTELRLARWYFPGEKQLGSGTELISTNHKTDIKIQLKLNF